MMSSEGKVVVEVEGESATSLPGTSSHHQVCQVDSDTKDDQTNRRENTVRRLSSVEERLQEGSESLSDAIHTSHVVLDVDSSYVSDSLKDSVTISNTGAVGESQGDTALHSHTQTERDSLGTVTPIESDPQATSDTPTSPSYPDSSASSCDLSDLPPPYDSLLVSKPPAHWPSQDPGNEDSSGEHSSPPPPYDLSERSQGEPKAVDNNNRVKEIQGEPEDGSASPPVVEAINVFEGNQKSTSTSAVLELWDGVPGKREATYPVKRHRKKPCVEEPLADIAEHPNYHQYHYPVYSCDDQHQPQPPQGHKLRLPHVVVTLDDSDMKIQPEFKKKKLVKDVEVALASHDKEKKTKSVFFYVEEDELESYIRKPSHMRKESLKKRYETEEQECFRKMSLENVRKGFEEKDEEEHKKELKRKLDINKSEPKRKYSGQDNLGFVDDERKLGSSFEVLKPPPKSDSSTFERERRRSDPECLLVVKEDDQLYRSRSCGNDLNEMEGPSPLASPILRKRSLSRGRPEFPSSTTDAGKSDRGSGRERHKETSFTHETRHKKDGRNGDSSEDSPSLLRRIISSPLLLLSRSESTRSAPPPTIEDGLPRASSITWDESVSCAGSTRTPRGINRPPQAPSSICSDRHSSKSYIHHHHLYRNSRRNVQQKLHRQLSEPRHDYHHHLHAHHHKKHDPHHRSNKDIHCDCQSDSCYNSTPSTSTHHHHHRPPHKDHHHKDHNHHNNQHHHHRSQSQRNIVRPKHHEPLRRLNTYGHEEYQKYVQEHEHRCEQEQSLGVVGEGVVSGRKLSHYRQEEKGSTDVERWVGVHGGGNGSEEGGGGGNPGSPNSPTSPTTPHIVVSAEDDDIPDEVLHTNTEGDPLTTTTNGDVCINGQSSQALPPTPIISNLEKSQLQPEKTSVSWGNTDLPDTRHLSLDFAAYRKTRRNSMNEIYRRVSGSQMNLQIPSSAGGGGGGGGHHNSNGHNNIRRSSSRNSLVPSVLDWRQEGNDSLVACVSALYGKLLVVMGMAFPVAQVISHDIPISFYNGFYLYLYIGSILFLVYAYIFLLQSINLPTTHFKSKIQTLKSRIVMPELNINMVFPRRNTASEGTGRMASRDSRLNGGYDADRESDHGSVNTMSIKPAKYGLMESNNHGSMYLKMGAVLFGIGSMIYSGLEVGQYFELQADDSCADILLVISPAARMLFTFIQMYFIFLNSRVAISRHRVIARFGLMHMIGTNLCIWLNVLVEETKHEIINLRYGHGNHHGVSEAMSSITKEHDSNNHGSGHHGDSAVLGHHDAGAAHAVTTLTPDLATHAAAINSSGHNDTHHMDDIHKVANASRNILRRATKPDGSSIYDTASSLYECSRSELMGELVDNASPFLFPCTIEYSLLCAGVLYVIWNNINKPEVAYDGDSDISTYVARKARHHYSVDCAHANRGLFMGILMLVLTIISLILFFVLINNEDYKSIAIMEANIIELTVYGVATVTVVIGMIQMRELEFIPDGDIELDNILLLIAQTGVYIYTSFTVIGGHFTMSEQEFMILPLLSAIITLTQTTLQTIFILDATRRCCYNHEQLERKPGREMVTFLLVCNLAMWAINTFETSRADAHPTQLNFYGIWAWTIISHISMPLAIFYRFHVTVCLCEIWKRSYKLKNEY